MINIKEFGGIAIEDAGWDDYRPVEPEKRRFSDLAYEMFNPPATEPWKAAITTTTTTTPAPLSKTIKKIDFIMELPPGISGNLPFFALAPLEITFSIEFWLTLLEFQFQNFT